MSRLSRIPPLAARLAGALALALFAMAPGAGATERRVDLALVLAVDVSHSIDDQDGWVQREGYVRAFRDPRVIDAIRGGGAGAIAVAYVEWSSEDIQRLVVDWTFVDSAEAARSVAERLASAPRETFAWTSLSGAIDYSVSLLDRLPFAAERRVIDISGDGPNNHGRPSGDARDAAVKLGITINGLAIKRPRPAYFVPPEPAIDTYYEKHVIGGPNHFLVVAIEPQAFARAILQKLLREIADADGPRRAEIGRRAYAMLLPEDEAHPPGKRTGARAGDPPT